MSSNFRKRHDSGTRNAKAIVVMVGCICVCLAFVAGFLVRGDEALLKNLGFNALVMSKNENPGQTVTGNTSDSISARVAEVEGILETESLDRYSLDQTTSETLAAFTDSTDDPYLRYFDPSRYAAYIEDSTGKHFGVGVLFSEYNGKAYAVEVLPGSSAEAAGIHQGDFVVAINGDRTQDWSLAEAVNAVSQEEGSSVVVTWRRPASLEAEGGDEFTTTLECSSNTGENVSYELQGRVGYITLRQLTQNSSDLVRQAINDLTAQGASSFVLDIRNNPGGYLTQAVDISSSFIKSGVVVRIQTKQEHATTKSATGATLTDKPLVVLVNENTAAAAEVLAAALKDNKRATVMGSTTLGKGSVQVIRPLSFGGALRYTAAYYVSPLGHEIHKAGVTPNIMVNHTTGPEDNQKNLAIETAQSLALG